MLLVAVKMVVCLGMGLIDVWVCDYVVGGRSLIVVSIVVGYACCFMVAVFTEVSCGGRGGGMKK